MALQNVKQEIVQWTGNGAAPDRLIATSFALDVGTVAIWIFSESRGVLFRHNGVGMTKTVKASAGGSGSTTGGIIAFQSGGFTVNDDGGTNINANENTRKYTAWVIRDTGGDCLAVGNYTGNSTAIGTAARAITTPFQPAHVWVWGTDVRYRSIDFTGDDSVNLTERAVSGFAGHVTAFGSTDFTVKHNAADGDSVNLNGFAYFWVAFSSLVQAENTFFRSFKVTGTAGADQATGIGFTPSIAVAKRHTSGGAFAAEFKGPDQAGTTSALCDGTSTVNPSGGIDALGVGTVSIGNDIAANGVDVYGFAFVGYAPVPALISCTPAFGPTDGGTAVTLLASNLFTDYDTLVVTFDGAAATDVVLVDTEHITCTVPAGADGAADIVATFTSGAVVTAPTLLAGYTYRPEITFTNDGGIGLTWVELTDKAGVLHVSSKVALPDPATYYGGYKEDRVLRWGTISRGLSDRDGQIEGVTFQWTESDTDRVNRALMGTAPTKYLADRLVSARMIDDDSRRLQLTPRTVFKGVVSDYRPLSPLHFEFSARDWMFSRFSPDSGDAQVPVRTITTADFPGASAKYTAADGGEVEVGAAGLPVPIIYGRISDYHLNGSDDDGDGQCPGIYVGVENKGGTDYHAWLLHGAAVQGVYAVYLENGDGGLGTVPASTNIGDLAAVAATGTPDDWLIPGINGQPKFEDRNGNRYAVVYGKVGNTQADTAAGLVEPATRGVPIAFDVAGIEDVGDGSGALITDLFDQYLHILQNWILDTYASGAWLATPVFDDEPGVAMIDEDSIATAKALAIARNGGIVGDFIIGWTSQTGSGARLGGDFISVRDLLARLNVSAGCDSAFNRRCQYFVSLIDDDATELEDAVPLTDISDIHKGSFEITPDLKAHFNVVPYRHTQDYFGRDPAGWRSVETGELEKTDTFSIDNYGKRKVSPVLNLYMIRGTNRASDYTGYAQGTIAAEDLVLRYLQFHRDPPNVVKLTTGLGGLNIELGQILLLDEFQGLSETGWEGHPVRVQRHVADPDQDQVTLECLDMRPILADAFILGDDDVLPDDWLDADEDERVYGYQCDEDTDRFTDGELGKRLT